MTPAPANSATGVSSHAPIGIGLSFDLRNPVDWFEPWADRYRATLDLIAHAEEIGLDAVKVTEHHMFADGYLPQPLVFLAAAAARTTRIRLATGILIAPLHSAVEIAEQAAVVDCMSGGRLELGIGTGYRLPEYALYGVPFDRRLSLFEERVTDIRRLWSEEITPRPVQSPIPIWAGLRAPKGSRLAGMLGLGRLHLGMENWDHYIAGLEEGGYGSDAARLAGSIRVVLAEDPERTLSELAPRIEYNRRTYAQYAVEGKETGDGKAADGSRADRTGLEVVRLVLTPEQAAEYVREVVAGRRAEMVYLAGAIAGKIDEIAYRSAELAATRLKPLLGWTVSGSADETAAPSMSGSPPASRAATRPA